MNTPIHALRTMSVSFFIIAVACFFCGINPASAASDTWTGGTDTNWTSPGNWTGGNAPPLAGDSLIFGSSGLTTLNNNFPALTAFDGIAFSGGSQYTLNGNGVLLSGSNVNTIGVSNNSFFAQTIGTMPLTLDWGYFTFSSPSGGTIALNGGLSVNTGGVAYFDINVTSTSLTTDGSGLISGLGGAGLIFGTTSAPAGGQGPTALATISGGSITPLTTFTSYASGVISSGQNLLLTASGAAASLTAANGTTVDTISVAQVGNSGGTFTTTLAVAASGTMTFSNHGGIYVLKSGAGTKGGFTLSSGTGGFITAGNGTSPASIVVAVDGDNAGNQATISSTIKDNTVNGPVSLIISGTGGVAVNSASSTYSGGVYVNQGQFQGNTTSVGTGPIYVAPGATAYLNGAGTYTNNIFISPGFGTVIQTGTNANPGAILLSGSGAAIFIGTLTLSGPPVPDASVGSVAGDRLTGGNVANNTYTFANQITGTGTLDLNADIRSCTMVISNTSLVNTNNWQGGMFIEESLNAPTSPRNITVKLGANNQIPGGAGAGDVTLYDADASSQDSLVRLDLNGFNASINGLNASAFSITLPQVADFGTTNSTLTFGGNNASGTFNGTTLDNGVGKALSLVKIGTGTETFRSTLSHHGNTTVSSGTLVLNGSANPTNSPVITVASGATLDASGLGTLTVGSAQTLNCVGTFVGSTTVDGTIMALDAIGTFTNNGNMTFNSGGTYVWDVNNFTGTAGADPGWSVLNIQGGLQINATTGSPFNVDITSLTSGDVAGNADNFNSRASSSWIIAATTGGITGFTGPGQFNVVTTAFSNSPTSSAKWSVGVSGTNLVLNYVSVPAIITPLTDQTNGSGTTATFSVGANVNGMTSPITYQWLQGSTPLASGDFSASGGVVTITTNGLTSTLSIANVQDADAGGFTVNVSDNFGDSGSSSATLTIIDPPSNPNLTQSLASPPVTAGAVDFLSASASGTQPFTYQWYLGTNAIFGATNSTYTLNISGSAAGSYTVVISNLAGSVSDATVIAPVSSVPNQIVFEPFNYPTQATTQSAGNPWTAFGVTNIYNQATGVGLMWVNTGTLGQEWTLAQDMRIEPGYTNEYNNYVANVNSPSGDIYPWPGLAGNDPREMACNSAGTAVNLPLGAGGSLSNGPVYFSVIMHVDQGGAITTVTNVFDCGFGTGATNSTTYNTGIYLSTPGDDTYIPGVFKTSGGTASLNPGVNGNWSTKHYHRGEIVFAVCRLVINPSGGSTCDLWLDPNPSTFYASEANRPAADVSTVGGGAPDVGNVDFFFVKNNNFPASRRYTDLRIGTTWASVTPPSAPTLALGNVYAPVGTTAVFASQNAGNPVTTPYQWQFDGGSPLTDGSHYSGTQTATLTISNVTGADVGTYKVVTGTNSNPSGPLGNGGTLTGTASAILSTQPPELEVYFSAPDVVVLWPTNWTGFLLEQSPSASPTSWTTNSLPPYAVSGTNNAVLVPASGTQFFRLKH